jgi:hypothetical protein
MNHKFLQNFVYFNSHVYNDIDFQDPRLYRSVNTAHDFTTPNT